MVPGASLILCMGVGFVGMLSAQAFWSSPAVPVHDGQWGEAWEAAVDDDVFFHQPSVDAWGIAELVLFRDGRPGVVLGDEGWLFTGEDFAVYPDDDAEVARKGRIVEAVRGAMRERGVRLLVAVIPSKARIETEHLGRYRVPAQVAARAGAFVADLRGRGVEVVELEPALRERRATTQVFLRTDTHWTPDGASAAAHAIATALRTGDPPAWLDSAAVTSRPGDPAPYDGDLMRYLPLGGLRDELGPRPDTLATPQVTVEAAGGLLDDVAIPVALVGTSYSDDPRWGFLGALQRELGADVLNAAAEGQGPFVSMTRYMANDAWANTPPSLVIWEIPERYLGVAYDLEAPWP